MSSVRLLLVVAPVVLLVDLVWLGVLMKPFYEQQIGVLARREGAALAPRWPAALGVYLLIPAGIVLFVRPHLGPEAHAGQAIAWGAAYGLVVYGVYDLTNRAVLQHWPLLLTLVDIAWGCSLCGLGGLVLWAALRYGLR